MKLLSVLSMFVIVVSFLLSQDVKEIAKTNETKLDVFASKTGSLIKSIDYPLPNISTSFGQVVEARVRKLIRGNEVKYFFQISCEGKYSTKTASIEYADLLEVLKAFSSLKTEAILDALDKLYVENKFITEDGFQLGYYVNEGKSHWYMKLEKYGSGSENMVFLNNSTSVEQVLNGAKNKIEELMK